MRISNLYLQGIILGSTIDMKFNMYDRNLHLLETIRHDVRTIISMKHDTTTGLILVASAYNLSVWRAYRSLDLGKYFVDHLMAVKSYEGNQWQKI